MDNHQFEVAKKLHSEGYLAYATVRSASFFFSFSFLSSFLFFFFSFSFLFFSFLLYSDWIEVYQMIFRIV